MCTRVLQFSALDYVKSRARAQSKDFFNENKPHVCPSQRVQHTLHWPTAALCSVKPPPPTEPPGDRAINRDRTEARRGVCLPCRLALFYYTSLLRKSAIINVRPSSQRKYLPQSALLRLYPPTSAFPIPGAVPSRGCQLANFSIRQSSEQNEQTEPSCEDEYFGIWLDVWRTVHGTTLYG